MSNSSITFDNSGFGDPPGTIFDNNTPANISYNTIGAVAGTNGTASYALTASFAMNGGGGGGSLTVVGGSTVTGVTTLTFSGGTVSGTTPNATVTISGGVSASYAASASVAVSASYAISSSLAFFATSASFTSTASYVVLAQTASYVVLAQTASYVSQAVSASYAISSSVAVSSSYALTASFATTSSYATQADLALTASSVNNLTQDVVISKSGGSLLSMQAGGAGGAEFRLLPNSTGGYARINVGNANASLDFQMNSSTKATITQAGNVGIGTTTPTAVLHLKAGTAAASSAPLKFTAGTNLTTPEDGAIEFDGNSLFFTTGSTRSILFPSSQGTASYAIQALTASSVTTLAQDVAISKQGGSLLSMTAGSAGGTEIRLLPNTTAGFARINVGNTNQPLDFQMNSSTKVTITQAGNVGIGTASPTRKLTVVGDIGILNDGSDSIVSNLYIGNAANTRAYNFQPNAAGTNLALWGYNSSNNWQNLVNFNYDGNVGIGTTTPNAKLDVNGNVYATSFTGLLYGTASYATNATNASFVPFTGITSLPAALIGDGGFGGVSDVGKIQGSTSSSLLTNGTFYTLLVNSPMSLTLETGSNIGFEFTVFAQILTADFEFIAEAGQTIISVDGNLKINKEGSSAVAKYIGGDKWALIGDLKA